MIEVLYPIGLLYDAEQIGEARYKNVSDRNLVPFEGKKSKISANDASINGVLGELIVEYYCKINDIKHTSIERIPSGGAPTFDLKVQGVGVDVKTILKNHFYFLVEERSHKKYTGVDAYVFVRLIEAGVAEMYQFTHKEVETWLLGDCIGHGRISYYKEI